MFYAQLNNIGTILRLDVALASDASDWDISSSSTKKILLKSDAGVTTIFTAAFTNDGTDGLLEYKTAATTDLNIIGNWSIQGHCTFPDGSDLKTRAAPFKVLENL